MFAIKNYPLTNSALINSYYTVELLTLLCEQKLLIINLGTGNLNAK